MKTYEQIIAEMAKRHPGDDKVAFKRGTMVAPNVRMDERIISGMITTVNKGIDGMVVPGEAFDLSYFRGCGVNSVYLNHDYTQLPIGKCVTLQAKNGGLWCRTWIDESELGNDILRMVGNGCLNGFSSGFRIRDGGTPVAQERAMWGLDAKDDDVVLVRDALLLEYSVVAMPADGNSRIDELVTRGVVRRESADLVFGRSSAKPQRILYPVVEAEVFEEVRA